MTSSAPRVAVLLVAALLAPCSTVRTSKRNLARAAVLHEDRLGVPGAPVDLLDFEFEPASGDVPSAMEVDGLSLTAPDLAERLEPYLDSRRARLQTVSSDGSFVVLTRLGRVAQAYTVDGAGETLVPITRSNGPIIQIARAPGPQFAWVYRSDVLGTEDFQLTRLDSDGESLITDGESRHGPFTSSRATGLLAFTSNARNGRDMDIYLADGTSPSSGELALKRTGSWSASSWSPTGKQLLLREYVSYSESYFSVFSPKTSKVHRLPAPRPSATTRARFSAPDTIHMVSNRGGDYMHLFEVTWPALEFTDLTPDLAWDVEEVVSFDSGQRLAYTTNEGGISRVWLRDRGSDARMVDVGEGAVVSDLRFAKSGSELAFTLDRAADTGDVWTANIETGELTRITESRSGGLDYSQFVEPRLASVRSFDDVELPTFVYEPRAQHAPLPVLLWMHGGPEEQHQPTFHPIIQFLVAELGVAVVAPNIRGSSGYGNEYLSLDDGMRREDAIRDVGALLDWIAASPQFDASRVAIYGGSYGGFVTLAALARYGERLAAGIDQVGVSNFVTFLEATRDYRVDPRRAEYGDERDPEMRAFLESISPTNNAHLIRSPLLVAHGANDPRVPVAEARQIVMAVRENGGKAGLMVAMDEGHGFQKRGNRDRFYQAFVQFLVEELELTF